MTKRKHGRPALTDWQKTAIADLRAIASARPHDLEIVGKTEITEAGIACVKINLDTTEIELRPSGLPLRWNEEFVIGIDRTGLLPPIVEVEHDRFVGYPHVLHGQRLCIYLDPSREWDPAGGINAALNRLWDWLCDAAAAAFNASTALYHAVGGILHRTSGAPTIVVRETSSYRSRARTGFLTHRTDTRLDLGYQRSTSDQLHVPVIALPSALPFGAGATLDLLVTIVDNPYLGNRFGPVSRVDVPSPALLTALAASASRAPHDSPQYFVLTVPHPAGGPPHLLAGRIPATDANELRRVVRDRTTPLIEIDVSTLGQRIRIEWCSVSDERKEVTTRRDAGRPVNAFTGKNVHVWGCGGIGSWVAEFIARAGVAKISICDPGIITGGLLVRQNYVEHDIGDSKAEALARRLRAIGDDLDVAAHTGILPEDLATLATTADVIIDATINIAVGQVLDALAAIDNRTTVLAQVATDARSGTLGMLTVSTPPDVNGPNTIDEQAGKAVLADAGLEGYHTFWSDPSGGDELIPTRGCSVPTFHGSAADLAAVAASLVTLLGNHLTTTISGTHLIALPHADAGPRHHFLRAA